MGFLQRDASMRALRSDRQNLSGSNATPRVSRCSCRATLVSKFSPYVFAVSHENCTTPLKVSQKALSHPFGGGAAP